MKTIIHQSFGVVNIEKEKISFNNNDSTLKQKRIEIKIGDVLLKNKLPLTWLKRMDEELYSRANPSSIELLFNIYLLVFEGEINFQSGHVFSGKHVINFIESGNEIRVRTKGVVIIGGKKFNLDKLEDKTYKLTDLVRLSANNDLFNLDPFLKFFEWGISATHTGTTLMFGKRAKIARKGLIKFLKSCIERALTKSIKEAIEIIIENYIYFLKKAKVDLLDIQRIDKEKIIKKSINKGVEDAWKKFAISLVNELFKKIRLKKLEKKLEKLHLNLLNKPLFQKYKKNITNIIFNHLTDQFLSLVDKLEKTGPDKKLADELKLGIMEELRKVITKITDEFIEVVLLQKDVQ